MELEITTPRQAAMLQKAELVECFIGHYKEAVQQERGVFKTPDWRGHKLGEFYALVPQLNANGFEKHVITQLNRLLQMPIPQEFGRLFDGCQSIEPPGSNMEKTLRWVVGGVDRDIVIQLGASTKGEVLQAAVNSFAGMYTVLQTWTKNTSLLREMMAAVPELNIAKLEAAFSEWHSESKKIGYEVRDTEFRPEVEKAFAPMDIERLAMLRKRFNDVTEQEEDDVESEMERSGV